jgi:hypothetical protein
MERRSILAAGVALALSARTIPGALAQPARLKEAIVGDWMLLSLGATRADGSAATPYGPRAMGTAQFEPGGRFAIILINPDIPKFASNDREKPTPAEALTAATGSTAIYGTYSINSADRTLLLHVEASSYPNYNGTDQSRVVKSISETELVLVSPATPNSGATVQLTFKKVG